MTDVNQQTEVRNADAPFALAPMTIADILDVSFELIKANWRAISLLSLALSVPLAIATFLISLIFDGDAGQVTGSPLDGFFNLGTQSTAAVIAVSLVSGAISVAVTPFITGAITRIVAGTFLGRDFDAQSALKSMFPFWPALIGANLVAHLALIPGSLAFGVGYFAVSTIFWVVVPVIAVEETGASDALRRSWRLIAPRFFPYLGAWFVCAIVAQLLGTIVPIVPQIAALVTSDSTFFSALFSGMSTVVATLVVTPFSAVVATLVYFDARVRVEGFDVQMSAARLPEPVDPQGPVVP